MLWPFICDRQDEQRGSLAQIQVQLNPQNVRETAHFLKLSHYTSKQGNGRTYGSHFTYTDSTNRAERNSFIGSELQAQWSAKVFWCSWTSFDATKPYSNDISALYSPNIILSLQGQNESDNGIQYYSWCLLLWLYCSYLLIYWALTSKVVLADIEYVPDCSYVPLAVCYNDHSFFSIYNVIPQTHLCR